MPDHHASSQPADDDFPDTTITLLGRLHSADEEQRRTALAQVAQRYWFPLYRYARTRGLDAHAASDAVQEFFHHLLSREEAFTRYDEKLGCLRGWIITIFRNLLASRKEHDRRLRRGGGIEHIAFDVHEAERFILLEPEEQGTPEELFDRGFARQLWRQVLDTVRTHYAHRRREHIFEKLHPLILGDLKNYPKTTTELAAELGLNGQNELKVTLHRLRTEAAKEFKRAVYDVVQGDGWHDEVRYLLKLIG
jgi:DNA-directed RNA polymerase specialized sigma24 family protein